MVNIHKVMPVWVDNTFLQSILFQCPNMKCPIEFSGQNAREQQMLIWL